MNPVEEIAEVRKKYPDVLWLVDSVSSMAGAKIEVDKLGIDVCITSTQKALALPPGMAICSVTPRALEHGKQVKHRGWYLDILEIYKYIETKDYQYSATPSLSHMFAMNFQLDRILAEGLEKRYARHKEMAEYARAWAKKHFALYPEEKLCLGHADDHHQHDGLLGEGAQRRPRKDGDADLQRLWRPEGEDLPHRAHGRTDPGGCPGSHRGHRKDPADAERFRAVNGHCEAFDASDTTSSRMEGLLRSRSIFAIQLVPHLLTTTSQVPRGNCSTIQRIPAAAGTRRPGCGQTV